MKVKWFIPVAVCSVCCVFLYPSGSSGDSLSKLAPDLLTLLQSATDPSTRVGVIVQTYGPVNADDLSEVYAHDGDLYDAYEYFHGYAASFPLNQLESLAALARVKRISPDLKVRGKMSAVIPTVGANTAWTEKGVSGRGVTVAVLDSGTKPHPDLKTTRVVAWKDMVGSATKAYDDNGHGTHVSGIVAGDGSASTSYSARFYGVAPKAVIASVKVLDSEGAGWVSNVIAGIDWCLKYRVNYNIRVMNMSLGHAVRESYITDPLCQALELAWKSGIVAVVAAGNRGRLFADQPDGPPSFMSIDSPGNDPYVITVGATNTRGTVSPSDDVMASYSSHGPSAIDFVLKPDLVAPGNLVISLLASNSYLPQTYPQNLIAPKSYGSKGSPQYFILSGTSMAAAVVSGAAALVLEANPGITPDTVKARLMASADRNVKNRDGTKASLFFQGAGSLNARRALDQTNQNILWGYAWSPVTLRQPVADLFLLTTGELGSLGGLIWNSNTIWGMASGIYGSNALWADGGLMGGSNALWADSWYDHKLYSDDSVWGGNALWADSGEDAGMMIAADGDGR